MNSAQIDPNFNNGHNHKALLQKYENNLSCIYTY